MVIVATARTATRHERCSLAGSGRFHGSARDVLGSFGSRDCALAAVTSLLEELLPVVMIVVQQLPVAGNQGTCNRIRLFGDICIDLKDVFAFFSNQAACRLTLACELNVLAA